VSFASQAMSGTMRRNPLFMLAFIGFAAIVAYEAAEFVIHDDLAALAYIAMAFIVGVFVVTMLNNWRNGLYLFVGWLLFEDFARKFLGNNMAIYFAKDFLVAVVYLSFFLAYRRHLVNSFRPPFLTPLLLFVWFGVMQMFNPAATTLLYGVLGLKLFFCYIPLLFVGYALLNSEAELRRFFFINTFLVLIIASLGLAQAVLGHTFLNPGAPQEEIRALSTTYRVSPITGLISYRPTSVFVSTGRFGDFLLVSWLLILGFTGYLLLRHGRGRNFAFLALTTIFAAIVLGSARGVLLWGVGSALIISVAFVWGAPWRRREVMRVFQAVQRAALGVVLAFVFLGFVFPDALASRLAFYTETLWSDGSTGELGYRAWDYPLRNFLGAFDYPRWLYGYGIGTASLGVQYIAKIFHEKPMGLGVESGYGTLVLEMGVGGLILWLVMSGAIVLTAWRVVQKLRGSPWFPLGFVIFWYAFLLLFPMTFSGMQPYHDFVLNAYLWLLLGILFRLPHLVLSAQFGAGAQLEQNSRVWKR
jgi:hypothetical protein